MKWLVVALSFIYKKMTSQRSPSLKETAVEIFEEISHKSRRIVALTLAGVGAVIFLTGGFFISLINATTQYDEAGKVAMSATLSGGLGLIVLALITFGVVFLQAWPGIQKRKRHEKELKEAAMAGGPLEQALALLVTDYVKEREMRRSERQSGFTTAEGATSPGTEPVMEREPSSSAIH